MFMHDDHDLMEAFVGYLERVGRTASTQEIYVGAVEQLLATTDGPLATLTATEIDTHLSSWRTTFFQQHRRLPSPATYKNRVNALRAFYTWMERFDLLRAPDGTLHANPMRTIDAPRVEQRPNDWLRPVEDRALHSAPIPEHERFIVMLLRWTGLRVSEAVSLTVSDVDLMRGNETLFVRESKTPAGRRSIPVLPPLLTDLRAKVEKLGPAIGASADAPILITRNASAMKATYVWRVVKRASFRAGVRVVPCTCGSPATAHAQECSRTKTGEHLSRVTPHTLRRTFGSHLLNRGVRLEVVSSLLGHASTSVTEKAYAELLYETARREVLEALKAR
jgi:integrase/recombinase XerD